MSIYKQTSFAPLLKAFNAQDERSFRFSEIQLYGLKLIDYTSHYRGFDKIHSHGLWEIHLYESGRQTYWINEREVEVKAGEMLLILPGTRHRQICGEESYRKFSLTIRLGKHIDSLCADGTTGYHVLPSPAGTLKIMGYLFENVNIAEQSSLFELRCCMELFLVRLAGALAALIDHTDQNNTQSKLMSFGGSETDFCERVLQYIRGNVTRSLSVQEIADEFAISSRHLCRKLQAYYGKAPASIIAELRCNYAKELLAYSDLSISEIAEQVGFTDSSHFIRFFRRKEGQTPASYRKGFNEANYHRV